MNRGIEAAGNCPVYRGFLVNRYLGFSSEGPLSGIAMRVESILPAFDTVRLYRYILRFHRRSFISSVEKPPASGQRLVRQPDIQEGF